MATVTLIGKIVRTEGARIGDSAALSIIFLASGIFLLPILVYDEPHTTNANRYPPNQVISTHKP